MVARVMDKKVIVITGASSGIGEALARHVGKLGAHVALVARRREMLEGIATSIGESALVVVHDVTSRNEVRAAFDETIARFGHIDVWVNNAGRGISRPVSQLSDEDFDEMMLVNVKSALYGMQTVLPHFRERGAGHVINVSSLLGRIPLAPIRSAYSASKHALNALTASLRMELMQDFPGIMISSVHPGVVATEFGLNALHGGMDSRKMPGGQTADEVAQVIADVISSPRADVYTRSGAQQMIVNYYSAPDMMSVERELVSRGPAMPPR